MRLWFGFGFGSVTCNYAQFTVLTIVSTTCNYDTLKSNTFILFFISSFGSY